MFVCMSAFFFCSYTTTARDCTDKILLSRSQQIVNLPLTITRLWHTQTNNHDNSRYVTFVWGNPNSQSLSLCLSPAWVHISHHLVPSQKTQYSHIHYNSQRLCYHFHIYRFFVSKVLCLSGKRNGMLSTHVITINLHTSNH